MSPEPEQALHDAASEAESLAERIKRAIMEQKSATEIHWGHVGNMNCVRQKLIEIASFLGVA